MKPNFKLDPTFYPNDDQFNDPFFKRFQLRKAPQPLQLSDEVSKHYSFPTLYSDVTCAQGIFFCNYEKAKAMLPHPWMEPIKGTLGRALVAISCYEYKNVLHIAPYNEIAMVIPIMINAGWAPPLLPLVMKSFKKSGYYVFSMPVTSYENQLRGNNIWGLPKVTEEISVTTQNDQCTTIAKDEQGTPYFEMTIPTSGKDKSFDETGYLYSVLNGELLKSQTNFKGDFKINVNAGKLLSKADKGQPAIILGNSPRAQALKDLELEQTPFQTRYCPSMNSVFDLAAERW